MGVDVIERINEQRKKKKMKFAELATVTNISQKYISEIFNNKANPSLDIVCKLAQALNMKLTVKGVRKSG